MVKAGTLTSSELLGMAEFYKADIPFAEIVEEVAAEGYSGYVTEILDSSPVTDSKSLNSLASVMAMRDAAFDWKAYATIRLLAYDDGLSCFCALVTKVRTSDIENIDADDEYTRVWRLLLAYAAGDQATVSKIRTKYVAPLKEGHPQTVRLYNEVMPMEGKSAGSHVKLVNKKDWVVTLCNAFTATDQASAFTVAEEHLALYRARGEFEPIDSVLPIELAGVLRMTDRLSSVTKMLGDESTSQMAAMMDRFSVDSFTDLIREAKCENLIHGIGY